MAHVTLLLGSSHSPISLDLSNSNAAQRFLREERRTLMQNQDTEYEAARAIDLAHNEQQEAHETLIASADYRHPVDHALVRSARLARLS